MIIPTTLSPRKASTMKAHGDSQEGKEGNILLPRFRAIGCPQSESLQRGLVEHDSPAADRVPPIGGLHSLHTELLVATLRRLRAARKSAPHADPLGRITSTDWDAATGRRVHAALGFLQSSIGRST